MDLNGAPFIKGRKYMGLPRAWGHFTPGGGVMTLTTLVITGSRVHLVRVDQFFFGFCGRFPSETNVREIKGYEIADLINLDLLYHGKSPCGKYSFLQPP